MPEPISMLDGAAASEGLTVALQDLGPVGQITLKGDLADPELGSAVMDLVGVAPPGALRATFQGERSAVWMAPDELLLVLPYAETGAAVAQLQNALAEQHAMAVDVSDARAVIRVSGEGAQELMAKGAPCDVSDRGFPVGTARRTHFAEVAVGIWRREETLWEMVSFQSYAPHLFAWLRASAGEASRVGHF
ncbi:MAG: sarcosine oxidase subunit gamma family protein [Pseudomonadota bacterium]